MYVESDSEHKGVQPASQVSVEDRKEIINKNKSKLEKLLAQPDIFDCLRRINAGQIKSYDELDNLDANGSVNQVQMASQSKRALVNNSKDEIEELNSNSNTDLFEILKIEH